MRKLVKINLVLPSKVIRCILMRLYRLQFLKTGHNLMLSTFDLFSNATIENVSYVFIRLGVKFSATNSGITIAEKVFFGPKVTTMGGDHKSQLVGKYMFDAKENRAEHDHIEMDFWIDGLEWKLKVARFWQGFAIAAGSIVVRDAEPYMIVGGTPAKQISTQFTTDQIAVHRSNLVPR